jgi:hypothetical protein
MVALKLNPSLPLASVSRVRARVEQRMAISLLYVCCCLHVLLPLSRSSLQPSLVSRPPTLQPSAFHRLQRKPRDVAPRRCVRAWQELDERIRQVIMP